MNKTAIKNFAIWARENLIESVKQRAFEYGVFNETSNFHPIDVIDGRILTELEKKQRNQLIEEIIAKGFDQVMEEAAYTWFNRFIALRYMEVNGYLPSKVRVFSNEEGEYKPAILDEILSVELETLDKEKAIELLEKQSNEELFKLLIIAQCNALSDGLPYMFEQISNWTELLFPNNLLRDDSVIGTMISTIPEEDWTDAIQIIGWLFEGYVQEKREKYRKLNVVNSSSMAAVNQVFTPDWIVQYMVENTVGKMWLESHPNSNIRSKMKYYLAPQEDRKTYEQKTNPQDIKVIEPCCGSGHVLVYVFDLLFDIYEEAGYARRDIPALIVENNIWGFDIDGRAAQLAYFSIMMKAVEHDRRFLKRNVQPHIFEVIDSTGISEDFVEIMKSDSFSEDSIKIAKYLVDEFIYGKTLGTTIEFDDMDYYHLISEIDQKKKCDINLINYHFYEYDAGQISRMAYLAIELRRKYDVLITNPPYSILSKLEDKPKQYILEHYPASNSRCNFCSVYLETHLLKENGLLAMLTSSLWTIQKNFENVRKYILENQSIMSMLFIGEQEVNAMVETVAFVISRSRFETKGMFYSLTECANRSEFVTLCSPSYINQNAFLNIPSCVINADHSEDSIVNQIDTLLTDELIGREGLHICDNERFLRLWFEIRRDSMMVGCSSIDESVESKKKWFPYCKGGEYRRWYGNNDYVVNWENDGLEIRNLRDPKTGKVKSHNYNGKYSFLEGLTWTYRTHAAFSVRYTPVGYLFDGKGSKAFAKKQENLFSIIGFLNSVVARKYLKLYATTAFEISSVLKIPFINEIVDDKECALLAKACIDLAKADYDCFETSWDFQRHPLIKFGSTIAEAFSSWEQESEKRFQEMKRNEERINQIIVDIYKMGSVLSSDIKDEEVTVRKADLQRDIKSLISYAVGCMVGRYSLDETGLINYGNEWESERYKTFKANMYGIIPITDDEYFEDDIVAQFVRFIETVYGSDNLEDNLTFIAAALGGKGTSREVIRNYFLDGFFVDHCKTYSISGSGKRPIYWLFDSGKKNGFKCLLYIHRYKPDTVARIRTEYVHELQSRYRILISDVENRLDSLLTTERIRVGKQLEKIKEQELELRVYEELVHHYADEMIPLELDDGVKTNYSKLEEILSKLK